MRIGVNTRLLLPGRMEGISRYTYEILTRMVAAHPEDDFVFFFDRPFDDRFIFASNVTPVVLRPVTRHPILWWLWFEFAIPKALKKYDIDVFLSTDTYMSLRTRVPTVLVSHDIAYAHYPEHMRWSIRSYYQRYFPRFHKAADKLIAVSSYTADDIADKYGIPRSYISVAHNAVPEGFADTIDSNKTKYQTMYSDGEPYFVYIGSLHPRKNIVKLIKAYEMYKEEGGQYSLLLIGRLAWNTQEIEKALEASNYRDDIKHLSNIGSEAKEIVASAEALVYVSLFEGFGIPILEAMATGVPVITSNVSSMPEVAGEAALLVNPHLIEEISAAMMKIESSPQLRAELSAKGLKQQERFSWEASMNTIYNACLSLQAKSSNGR